MYNIVTPFRMMRIRMRKITKNCPYAVNDPHRDRRDARFVALPCGRYQVELNYSARYKKFVPTIILQKGKDYKFHRGTKPKHAKGIILGKNTRTGWIEDSTHIVNSFTKLVTRAIRHNENVILVIK